MSDLGYFELTIYFAGWTGSVLYSMYHVYLIHGDSSSWLSQLLKPGWSWVNRKVDTTDSEWSLISPLLLKWLKFVVLYLVVNQFLIRNKFPRLAIGLSLAISITWLWFSIGLPLTLLLLSLPIFFILIFKLFRNSMISVWVLLLSIILALHNSSYLFHVMELIAKSNGNYTEIYIFSYILMWTLTRIISYIYDTKSWPQQCDIWNLVKCYHYCFYLPLLPSAPLILFQSFKESVEKTPEPWNWPDFINGVAKVMRYCFWWFFHELALHFFYHTAIQYDLNLVQSLDIWSAGGLGYTLGQFFMIKYVVFYGLPSALSHLDQVNAPPAPQCIGRIHLYSKMWRDFDRGLYNFMFQYIYIPFKKSYNGILASLFGSALCFSFVCIWHAVSKGVVIWCLANYLGVVLEMGAKFCSTLPPLSDWKANWSTANWLRFQAVFGAPLFLMSCLSNFTFFTNADVGYVFFYKAVIEGGLFRLCCILSIMYCGCHVSMAVSRFSEVAKRKPIAKEENKDN